MFYYYFFACEASQIRIYFFAIKMVTVKKINFYTFILNYSMHLATQCAVPKIHCHVKIFFSLHIWGNIRSNQKTQQRNNLYISICQMILSEVYLLCSTGCKHFNKHANQIIFWVLYFFHDTLFHCGAIISVNLSI